MRINNVKVFGIEDSIKRAKYPKSINTNKCNSDVTPIIKTLGHCAIGTGHDVALTGIIVQFDLTCSLKMWTQLQRYHFIDFISSQSTMHCITKFDIKEQCNEYVVKNSVETVESLVEDYKQNPTPENYLKVLYNVPSGFELTAGLTTNYRQLKTIYQQRRNHYILVA